MVYRSQTSAGGFFSIFWGELVVNSIFKTKSQNKIKSSEPLRCSVSKLHVYLTLWRHMEESESGPAETLDLWLTQMSVSGLYTKIHQCWTETEQRLLELHTEPFKAMKCWKHESEADSLIKARVFTFGPPRRGSVIYRRSLLTHRLSERDFTFSSARVWGETEHEGPEHSAERSPPEYRPQPTSEGLVLMVDLL